LISLAGFLTSLTDISPLGVLPHPLTPLLKERGERFGSVAFSPLLEERGQGVRFFLSAHPPIPKMHYI